MHLRRFIGSMSLLFSCFSFSFDSTILMKIMQIKRQPKFTHIDQKMEKSNKSNTRKKSILENTGGG